jgi:hypothetical protein
MHSGYLFLNYWLTGWSTLIAMKPYIFWRAKKSRSPIVQLPPPRGYFFANLYFFCCTCTRKLLICAITTSYHPSSQCEWNLAFWIDILKTFFSVKILKQVVEIIIVARLSGFQRL